MDFSWIEANVLAASQMPQHVDDIQALHEQGIRSIISLTESSIFETLTLPPALLHTLDISYQHVPIRDFYPPTLEQADEILHILDTMHTQNRATLVHCLAGIERTGTVLHLYYVAQGFSLAETRELIEATRPQCLTITKRQRLFLDQFIASRAL